MTQPTELSTSGFTGDFCVAAIHAGRDRAVPRPVIADVRLAPGKVLRGLVTDAHGQAASGRLVTVRHETTLIAAAKSDARGRFAIGGLRCGTYLLTANEGGALCRIWQDELAPANAEKIVTLVCDAPVALGQVRRIQERAPLALAFDVEPAA